jgi:hypothetical protein
MSPLAWSLAFGGTCLVAAAVISAVCLRMFAREQAEDAAYDTQRTEGMGDLASEPTPIFDQLAAEAVIASAGEVVAAEWKRAEVYDVDDWPGAS